MAARYTIPKQNEPLLDRAGNISTPWFNYLRTRFGDSAAADVEAQIADILARLTELEEGEETYPLIQGPESVSVTGSIENGLVRLSLVGDAADPGVSFYYGTDATGAKGWYLRDLATLADVDVVTTPPADGDVLTWDATAEKWVPAAGVGGGGDGGILVQIGNPSATSAVLTAGMTAQAIAAAGYELTGEWEAWCYPSGSIQIDVWVDAFANIPPTDADSICAGNEPQIVAGITASGSFPGPVTVDRTDGVTAYIDSVTSVKWVSLLLKGTRT